MILNTRQKNVEWADISIMLAGGELFNFTAIKFGIPTKKEHLFADGDMPVDIQSGERTPKGELTVLKGVLDALNDAAVAAGGRDIGDLVVDCVVYYKPSGTRLPRTRTIVQLQFTDYEEAMKEGDMKMECTLPFLAMDIF
jgi:hypothetical protein